MKRLLFCSAIFLTACSSFQQSKVETDSSFTVPKDIVSQFTATDSTRPTPSPSPVPVAAPVKTAKTKRKKRTKAKKEDATIATPSPTPTPTWSNRWTIKPIFRPGEHYVFDITYFGAVAGQLDLLTLPEKYIDNRKVYHIRGAARTTSIFSLFYRLNDVVETYIDADALFSYRCDMKLDESQQQRDVMELYDEKIHKIHYYSKLDSKKQGKHLDQYDADIDPFTQDSLSAFFYVRTLPLEMGQSYRFPVSTNGKMKTVQIDVVRKETLVTKAGEFPAIVVRPSVVLDGVLQTKGETYIWISDDPYRSILKIDAKIKVGSVIAYLRELEHGDEKASPAPAVEKP